MKKLKLFMFIALFGTMCFGAYSAYEHVTMSQDERFLLANIEALTKFETADGRIAECILDGTPYCCTLNGSKLPGRIKYFN